MSVPYVNLDTGEVHCLGAKLFLGCPQVERLDFLEARKRPDQSVISRRIAASCSVGSVNSTPRATKPTALNSPGSRPDLRGAISNTTRYTSSNLDSLTFEQEPQIHAGPLLARQRQFCWPSINFADETFLVASADG